MPDDYRHCLKLLRDGDRERYLAVLYAPQGKRPALAALYAFDVEIGRIRNLVSEPLPGEIRLQWWRDVISGERRAEGAQHPVGAALLSAIDQYALPPAAFDSYLEARIFDLYHDPIPDRGTFEGYLGETVSVFFMLAAQILNDGADPVCADVAGHAGMAAGIAGILNDLSLHRKRQQVYIPRDVLQAAGTGAETLLEGTDSDALERVVSVVVAMGKEHLAAAEVGLAGMAMKPRTAFLPLATTGARLGLAEKRGAAVATEPRSLSHLRIQWLMLRRAISM